MSASSFHPSWVSCDPNVKNKFFHRTVLSSDTQPQFSGSPDYWYFQKTGDKFRGPHDPLRFDTLLLMIHRTQERGILIIEVLFYYLLLYIYYIG